MKFVVKHKIEFIGNIKVDLSFFNIYYEERLKLEVEVRGGRLEKGLRVDIERLLSIAKNKKPMNFEIFIVQPSLSKQKTSTSIMTLLGVTANYLKEVGDIDLKVIVNL